ncbi:uncharacterized protein EAE97_006212 [Botrytis byssoidea]|uniref:Uncharacterized protein n=1 Tax=Botrytis byssoidea TaxID=139641 RepID=A0A9P5M2M6_9HELO|nr:uncharacterized protein EAE97_006212 [Botrytis byssoidea]KAF7942758.1 hypothetical protein EAE97_006212 [Botrytis byssoidea]
MSSQQLCIRADHNLDLHLNFSADAPNYSPHIIHKTANPAGEKTDSVAATLVDVIRTILAYQCPWALVDLLDFSVEELYVSLDAFDETHCGFVARKDRKVQVVFNDMTSKKRWHYGYEILDDGQWILVIPGGFETETLVNHLIENEWLGYNAGFVRERDKRFEKPRLQIDAWLKYLERGITDTLDPSKERKRGLLDEINLSFFRSMVRMFLRSLFGGVGGWFL